MSELNEAVPPDAENPPTAVSSSSDNASVTNQIPPAAKTSKPDSSRPTSLPKPSGLKPPSKIGRLCSNSTPKPAVPISPRTDGSTLSDSVRKLSDDLSRKHLSDLIEDEEDEVSSSLPDRPRMHRKASTSSTYSMTSMDSLWEKHPRRLSEAGLRRSSDHSVVLTEDTDSFIIGERVWVGGTKAGQIAYIGETQFAPGEWAGIVLDDPIGKNDGSVAGVRYFQCSEKRGVFSRLTRLTRTPIISHDASPTSDAGSVFERPPSGLGRPRRTLSPNGSIRSVVSSKMNASISTTANGELRLGDRVIVSSSRGSKAGTLRYVGNTEFAPGVWAGVELDDPLGKNDGSVDGKRYFECSHRFGLFAPISKVSRSPSNRKPGACAIHSNGRATPLRRSNSRDSLTSLGTSIASSRIGGGRLPLGAQRMGPRAASTPVSAKNALQELLREKQHHLERLMRERELERAEVAKVSLQADRAETALAQVKKEATQASTENEKLKAELDKLNKMLEDEKQKVEDLMFRNEEENINKEDYYKYKEMMETDKATREQRIRELEAEVVLQAQRAEATAATLKAIEEQRAAETAAIAEQHKEELLAAQTLSSELQKLLDEAYALLKEKENEKDSIGKSMSDELSKVKSEYEKALNELKSKMSVAQTEFETQISVFNAKLQLAESKLEAEKQNLERLNKENSQTVIDLNTKLTQLQASLDDKTQEFNKVMGVNKEHEVNLNKEITKLKMELSAKVLDLEQVEDARKKKDSAFKELQEEFGRFKEEYSTKVNEYENLLTEASQQQEKNTSDILSLQQNLNLKTMEYAKLLADSSNTTSTSDKIIDEFKQTIHERDKEIIKLKDEFEQVNASFNIKHSKIAEEHKKEIEDCNTKIDQLIKEIETHKQAFNQSKVDFDTLNSQCTINLDELKAIKQENERLKQNVEELTNVNAELKTNMSAMELEVGELQRQLNSFKEKCDEIQTAKEKVEYEYLNLTGQATDSNEQFNKLSQHLKETEKDLQDLKDKHREIANTHGKIEQELKQKLFKLQEEYSSERSQLVRSVDEKVESLKAAIIKSKELEDQIVALKSRLSQIETSSDKLLDENSILKSEIEVLKVKEQELIKDYDLKCKKLEIESDKYKEQVSILKAEGASSDEKLMEKVDQLTEAQNDLNNKLEEARKHEDSLQKIVESMTSQLNNQKAQYENEISQMNTHLSSITDTSNIQKSEKIRLHEELSKKEKSLKDLTLKLEMLEVDVSSNIEIVSEKERQIIQINEELNKSVECKKELEEKLGLALLETTSLKQKYDNLLSNSSANDTMIRDQLSLLETMKKEVSALDAEKEKLQISLAENSNELNKLRGEKEELQQKLQENVNLNNELKKSLEEKHKVMNAQADSSDMINSRLKQLDEEVVQYKQAITKKDEELAERELQLNNLNDALKLGSNETQQVINKLQMETSELNQRYKNETESLNKTIKSLQSKVIEQDKHLEEFKQTKEKVVELQQLLIKSESDVKQLTDINEGQKTNYEDLNRQLQIQYDEHRKESKRKRHDLKDRLDIYETELKESKDKVNVEIQKQKDLDLKLSEANKNITELTNKLELASIYQNANVERNDQLEKVTLELQATRKSSAETLAKYETLVNSLRCEAANKVKELKQKEEYLSKLEEDVRNYKAKIEIVEREKIMLQKEISTKVKDKNDNNAMGTLGQGDIAAQKLVEEKEIIDGQVSFLNSVIVDMQRKNEQLMARVQALEGGTGTPSPVFNGRKPRAVAPRLFCDICDVFDAHDTEDCPKQCADPDAPVETPGKKKPPPRPYCDICEVFGHATEDCDEEETF